jgi:membrane protease YdiL (CAAX protease family)
MWAGAGLFISLVLMGVIATIAGALFPSFHTTPSFLEVQPLGSGEYHILLAWLPFFFFNIVGEELWWRGYIQPRNEAALGGLAWVVQAFFWTLFHVSFGWSIMLMVTPVLVIVPLVVQQRKNTWPGILIHGAVNGLGFLAVTLGLLPGQ